MLSLREIYAVQEYEGMAQIVTVKRRTTLSMARGATRLAIGR